MALKFKKIENLLVKRKSESTLERIIIDYSTLKQKIKNSESQSLYFKQGMGSSKQRLLSLNKDYEEIRKFFNESTIDVMIERINRNSTITFSYEGKSMGAIQLMHYNYLIDESKFFNELIRLKSKTELLMAVEYYLENPEDFLMFIE